MQLTRKHAFVLIMGFGLLFLAMPEPKNIQEREIMLIHPFLTDDACTVQEYFYYLGQHLAWLTVCVIMVLDAPKRVKYYAKWFFALNVVDLLDFLLSYNNLTIPFGPFDLTWNIIQFALLLGIVVLKRDEE